MTTAHCATDNARMTELGVWTDQLKTFLWEWMWFIGGLTDPFRLLVLGEWHCLCKETSFLPPRCSSSAVGALTREQDSQSWDTLWVCPMYLTDITAQHFPLGPVQMSGHLLLSCLIVQLHCHCWTQDWEPQGGKCKWWECGCMEFPPEGHLIPVGRLCNWDTAVLWRPRWITCFEAFFHFKL